MKRLFCLLITLSMLLGVCACNGEAQTYTVTFDTDGGSAVNPIAKTAGSDFSAPVPPTKDGYVFEGWYKDEACTELFAFGVMPAENLTLYAKWRAEGESSPSGDTSDETPDGNTPGDSTPGGSTPGGSTSGGENDGVVMDGGDRGEDGSWENVDFKGQAVKVCVSAHQSSAGNFPAASIYTKGPDAAGSNEVARAVVSRNTRAAEELNVTVVYETRNLGRDAAIADIRQIVMNSSKDSPDVYSNDLISLAYSMISGYLWNVNTISKPIKNYLDFSEDGWNKEFIKGCTFDQDKLYILAGDYFIDMIRMANVIYVNNDVLAAKMNALGKWCGSVDDFYGYVAEGYWDIDDLADMSNAVFTEGASGELGVTEKTDEVVGFAYNGDFHRVLSASSGITLYYQDKYDNYKPKVLEDVTDFWRVAAKFQALQSTVGVYFEEETKSSIECFLQGNFLFASGLLGEMEFPAMREFGYSVSAVPVPMWNSIDQDDYITTVHEEAELGAILITANAFSAASALMQFLNEESDDVVSSYYEKGLKFKYNSNSNARKMLDLIRDTSNAPFGYCIGPLCETLYIGVVPLKGLCITNKNTLASTFAAERDAYVDCLNRMVGKFATFE